MSEVCTGDCTVRTDPSSSLALGYPRDHVDHEHAQPDERQRDQRSEQSVEDSNPRRSVIAALIPLVPGLYACDEDQDRYQCGCDRQPSGDANDRTHSPRSLSRYLGARGPFAGRRRDTSEQLRAVDLTIVHEHVRVSVGGHGQVPLTHASSDLGPRDAIVVKQADPPVPENAE